MKKKTYAQQIGDLASIASKQPRICKREGDNAVIYAPIMTMNWWDAKVMLAVYQQKKLLTSSQSSIQSSAL
jgi:hypothetical protein